MKANLAAMAEAEGLELEKAIRDVEVRSAGSDADTLFLLPNELVTDPKYNVRPYSAEHDNGEESERVYKLSESLELDGQLDDMLAFTRQKGSDVERVVFIGSRRRRAYAMLNERRTSAGKEQLRCRVRIVREGQAKEILRKAIASNVQRQNLSAMDLALLIERLERDNGWDKVGFRGDKLCAAYLGVNVATVTQHKKFIGADKGIQARLHGGEISAQSAFELLEVPAARREDTMRRAAEIQKEEDLDKALKTKGGQKKKEEAVGAALANKRVQAPAVRKAIKEVAPEAKTKVTMKALLEWFDSQDGPGSAASVRAFVNYLVHRFAVGEGTERTLQDKWDQATVQATKQELAEAKKREEEEAEAKAQPKAAPKAAEKVKADKAEPKAKVGKKKKAAAKK
jgi:hypothetical protein